MPRYLTTSSTATANSVRDRCPARVANARWDPGLPVSSIGNQSIQGRVHRYWSSLAGRSLGIEGGIPVLRHGPLVRVMRSAIPALAPWISGSTRERNCQREAVHNGHCRLCPPERSLSGLPVEKGSKMHGAKYQYFQSVSNCRSLLSLLVSLCGMASLLMLLTSCSANTVASNKTSSSPIPPSSAESPKSYLEEGRNLFGKGAFEGAISKLTDASRLYEKSGSAEDQCEALIILSQAYQAIGEYNKASAKLGAGSSSVGEIRKSRSYCVDFRRYRQCLHCSGTRRASLSILE